MVAFKQNEMIDADAPDWRHWPNGQSQVSFELAQFRKQHLNIDW